jgi:hypothetical protein
MNQDELSPEIDLPQDLQCMRCGYPLRGLQASKACPECGLEIAATLAGPALGNANPFFLHRILYGVMGLAAGTSLLAMVYVVRLVNHLAESPSQPYEYWLNHVTLIAWTVQWCSALCLLAGRESLDSTHESEFSLRKLMMYSAILLFGVHIVPIGFLAQTPQSYLWYARVYSLLDYAALIILYLYIFTLVRRSGDLFLKQQYPFALAALAAALIFDFLLWHVWRGFSGSTLTAMYLLKIGAIGYLSFLLFRFRAALLLMLPMRAKDA